MLASVILLSIVFVASAQNSSNPLILIEQTKTWLDTSLDFMATEVTKIKNTADEYNREITTIIASCKKNTESYQANLIKEWDKLQSLIADVIGIDVLECARMAEHPNKTVDHLIMGRDACAATSLDESNENMKAINETAAERLDLLLYYKNHGNSCREKTAANPLSPESSVECMKLTGFEAMAESKSRLLLLLEKMDYLLYTVEDHLDMCITAAANSYVRQSLDRFEAVERCIERKILG